MARVRQLLDLLLPPRCPGCGVEGSVLCDACRAPLWRRVDEPPGAPLGMPVELPEGVVQLEWCATYSGPIRAALHALKYQGERRLRAPMAEAMAARWRSVNSGGDLITWVPVHPSRRRERGFDQAEELARATAVLLGLPVAGCLERRERTIAQHALGQQARADNTEGAFTATREALRLAPGRWVLLVDDIVTTGATMAACAAALHDVGVLSVSAMAVARDR